MKKALWYVFLAIVLLACVVFGNIAYIFFVMWSQSRVIHQEETRMQEPAVYLPIAKELALYCQSFGQELQTSAPADTFVEQEWLPDSIQKLPRTEFCTMGSDSMAITFGGGFYHFGYSLTKDSGVTPAGETVWHLFLSREEQPDLELTTVHLPESARLAFDDFVRTALRHYAEEIALKPQELRLDQEQLFFSLKFTTRQEAVKNLQVAIQNLPKHWWPRFALDLVLSRTAAPEPQDRFETWVAAHPGFSHYTYLVWLYRLQDKPDEAARAAETMLQFSPSDEDDDIENFYARAWDIATYFYQLGRYDTALHICEKMNQLPQQPANTGKDPFAGLFASLQDACQKRDPTLAEHLPKEFQDIKLDQDFWTHSILVDGTLDALRDSKP
jgi:tetratricopeptide (TPR) repeat protein